MLSVTEETKPLNSTEHQKLQETVNRSFALAYDLPYRLWINGNRGSWGTSMGGQMYYSFSGGEPLEVILEVYGDSVGEYGFNLFVNNLPVSEEPLLIHTEEGTKTLVTVLLDMSDFDGSAVLYGTLAAKNYEGYRNPNGAVAANGVFETETFYFSDAKDIYDLLGIEYPF